MHQPYESILSNHTQMYTSPYTALEIILNNNCTLKIGPKMPEGNLKCNPNKGCHSQAGTMGVLNALLGEGSVGRGL